MLTDQNTSFQQVWEFYMRKMSRSAAKPRNSLQEQLTTAGGQSKSH